MTRVDRGARTAIPSTQAASSPAAPAPQPAAVSGRPADAYSVTSVSTPLPVQGTAAGIESYIQSLLP